MCRAYYNEDEQAVYDDRQDIRNLDERFSQIQKDLARLIKILEKYDRDDGNDNNDYFSDIRDISMEEPSLHRQVDKIAADFMNKD